jgi:hypothetical protein
MIRIGFKAIAISPAVLEETDNRSQQNVVTLLSHETMKSGQSHQMRFRRAHPIGRSIADAPLVSASGATAQTNMMPNSMIAWRSLIFLASGLRPSPKR